MRKYQQKGIFPQLQYQIRIPNLEFFFPMMPFTVNVHSLYKEELMQGLIQEGCIICSIVHVVILFCFNGRGKGWTFAYTLGSELRHPGFNF